MDIDAEGHQDASGVKSTTNAAYKLPLLQRYVLPSGEGSMIAELRGNGSTTRSLTSSFKAFCMIVQAQTFKLRKTLSTKNTTVSSVKKLSLLLCLLVWEWQHSLEKSVGLSLHAQIIFVLFTVSGFGCSKRCYHGPPRL